MNPKQFTPGDRIKGLFAHKKKVGTVIEQQKLWVVIQWDGGKRKSTVEISRVELLSDRP